MKIRHLSTYKETSDGHTWVKITEKCVECGKIDRTLYWHTNCSSQLKIKWHESAPRKLKCHKMRAVETFTEGDEVRVEVNNLSPNDRNKYVGKIDF